MSLSDVVKNIYTFANILSQAGTDVVSHWDDRSLQNAFNWAKYCMKIEEQTRGKPYRDDLDLHVQSLTILLQPVSLLELTIDRLQHGLSVLCKRLLHNPDAPEYILDAVTKATAQAHVKEIATEAPGERWQTTIMTNKLYQLFEDDVLFANQTTKSLGCHVMDRLVHLQSLSKSSQNRFTRFLEKVTLKISTREIGWELLANMLLSEVMSMENHDVTEQVKHQIIRIVTTTDEVASRVWSCDCRLLCELSSRDDRFLDLHINRVVLWASEMEPVYGPTDDGEWYTWRYNGNIDSTDSLPFKKLVQHVTTFLNYNNRLRNTLEPQLREYTKQSFFSVWKDLLKEVEESNMIV